MAPFLSIFTSAVLDPWLEPALIAVISYVLIVIGFVAALWVLLKQQIKGMKLIGMMALIGLVINGLGLIVIPIGSYVMPQVLRVQHRDQLEQEIAELNQSMPQQVSEQLRFEEVGLLDDEVIQVKIRLSDAALAQLNPESWQREMVPTIQESMMHSPLAFYVEVGYQLVYSYYSSRDELVSEVYLTAGDLE